MNRMSRCFVTLFAASLPLLASTVARAESFPMVYVDLAAEIECTTDLGNVLAHVATSAPLQGGGGIEAIFDEAYAPLLDAQGEDDLREEMRALAIEELASMEQAIDALLVAYPDELLVDDMRACGDGGLRLFEDLGTSFVVEDPHQCNGDYKAAFEMDLATILGHEPLYIRDVQLAPELYGNHASESGIVKLHLSSSWDTGDYTVSCQMTTVATFVTQ